MGWFKHAFAIEKGVPEPTDIQREVIDKLCHQITKRHLTTPALAFLEMSRPLNYVSSQTMHFFMPIVKIITDARGIQAFAEFLEHRGSIEYICRRLEAVEAEYEAKQKVDRSKPDSETGTADPDAQHPPVDDDAAI